MLVPRHREHPIFASFLSGAALLLCMGCSNPEGELDAPPLSSALAPNTPANEPRVGTPAAPASAPATNAADALKDPSGTVDQDWWSRVQNKLSAGEYRFRPEGKRQIETGNRANNLRARFDARGVRLTARIAEEVKGAQVRTHAIGRGDTRRLIQNTAPQLGGCDSTGRQDERGACLKRLEYSLGAGVTEWWENRSEGLEQGWTIAEPPAGQGPLLVDLEVTGATVAATTDRVRLSTPGGLVLDYGSLLARDARGRQLSARFAASDAGMQVIVDDRDARYPIEIDPIYQTFFWSAESNQANSNFGFSLAGVGDVDDDGYTDLLVGAYLYDNGNDAEGAAFLYLGTELGPEDTAVWSAEGGQNSAYFGYSVAGAGDVNGDGKSDVIIGAYLYDDGEVDEGKAFVYHGTGSGLTGSPAWSTDSDQTQASFGLSVAGAGDVNNDGFDDVVVGAPSYDDTLPDEGAVYVFPGSNITGLSTTPLWLKPGGQQGANFGQAVASANVNNDAFDDIIVGAHLYEDASAGPADEGGAFVFLGASGGPANSPVWSAESNQGSQPDFGYAVANAGDINDDGYDDILVGARNYDGGSNNEGRVYLYLGSSSGPAGSVSWTDESDLATANFGASVAGAGDVNNDGFDDFLVGAPLADAGQTDEGRVYLYLGSAGGPVASYVAESNLAGAKMGMSVASAGDINADGYDDVLIGAPEFTMGQTKEGRAIVYLGTEAGLGAVLGISTFDSGQGTSYFGMSVAGAGDVNSDGYDDVIVGAYQYDNGQANEGRAFAFYGSHLGLPENANWTAERDQASANFAERVAAAGDVNNDGYDDVIIGARLYQDNAATSDEGAAFVYYGSAAGLAATPAWTGQGNQTQANFGVSVAGAGDVNNDGYDDVLVGANLYDNGELGEGVAFLYKGSATGPALAATWSAEGNQASAGYGFSVSSAGDVNNDGYDDVIIGAPQYNDGVSGEGKAFLYRGSSSGLLSSPSWTASGGLSGVNFGYSVARAGHVNNDNFGDVIVGAWKYANGQTAEGRAFVFHGVTGTVGLSTSASWYAESDQASAQFGESVASAGDVNDDGFDDVVVGASLYDNGETNEGSVFVYLGAIAGISGASWVLDNNVQNSTLGVSVAGAGDVNADGYDDIIAGAQNYDGPASGSADGRAYLFLGAACVGKDGVDVDGDSFKCPFDCDDADDAVYPGAGDATCDWVDDDCDGTQDEDYVEHATTCGFGVCQRSGQSSCTSGVEDDGCEPGLPTAADDATCDGTDQDCSGASDEDYVSTLRHCGFGVCHSTGMSSCVLGAESDNCTVGSPTAADDADCNTVDEDCSGEADEDYLETPTTCGVGACASTGAIDCVNGVVGDTCVVGTPALSDATCDGVDDDCDLVDDEDYVSELRHCGFGVCDSTGMSSCSLGVESDNCTPGTPTATDDADCNTIDEDCSGEADEDYLETPTTCGTQGACAATGAISCIAGVVQDTCTPGTAAADDQSCDGIDSDCDGNTDEDAMCTDAGDAGNDAGDAGEDAPIGGSGGQGGNGNAAGAGGNVSTAGRGGSEPDDNTPMDATAPDSGFGTGLPPPGQGSHTDDDPGRDAGETIFQDKAGANEAGCKCHLPGTKQPTQTPASVLLLLALGALCARRKSTNLGQRS